MYTAAILSFPEACQSGDTLSGPLQGHLHGQADKAQQLLEHLEGGKCSTRPPMGLLRLSSSLFPVSCWVNPRPSRLLLE